MPARLENRSLDRAITILEVLARGKPCTLHDLHQQTALAKSTIRRLLGTLMSRHLIRVGMTDGLYRANIALPWASEREATTMAARLVEVALPRMTQLTKTVKWPSSLHVYHAGRMRVIESTWAMSPFHVGALNPIEFDLNLFASATGLAVLAALSDRDVVNIVREHKNDPRWGLRRVGIKQAQLLEELRDIRKAGYATRRAGFNQRAAVKKFRAIAVAIRHERRPVGAINMQWPRDYLPVDQFARKHLADLRQCADAIAADLARLS